MKDLEHYSLFRTEIIPLLMPFYPAKNWQQFSVELQDRVKLRKQANLLGNNWCLGFYEDKK